MMYIYIVVLIKKGGGKRPFETLATPNRKVLNPDLNIKIREKVLTNFNLFPRKEIFF